MSVEKNQEQLNIGKQVAEVPSQIEMAPIATSENGLGHSSDLSSPVVTPPILETPRELVTQPTTIASEIIPDKIETSGDRWSRVIESKQQGVSPVVG